LDPSTLLRAGFRVWAAGGARPESDRRRIGRDVADDWPALRSFAVRQFL